MKMNSYSWSKIFSELFSRCCQQYQGGNRNFQTYYTEADQAFLAYIGYQPREFFDFVEDTCDSGDPGAGMSLLVAAVRRDYLHHVMGGETSATVLRPNDLPGRGEALGGITWLPRIIAKARAKLRGELDPDIMYGCGGDRSFLSSNGLAMDEFLRVVWASDGDDDAILAFVKASRS